MSDGLYQKYNVTRVDGSSEHDGCRVFVLDPNHDPHARSVLLIYATLVAEENPALAVDLEEWVNECYFGAGNNVAG